MDVSTRDELDQVRPSDARTRDAEMNTAPTIPRHNTRHPRYHGTAHAIRLPPHPNLARDAEGKGARVAEGERARDAEEKGARDAVGKGARGHAMAESEV